MLYTKQNHSQSFLIFEWLNKFYIINIGGYQMKEYWFILPAMIPIIVGVIVAMKKKK